MPVLKDMRCPTCGTEREEMVSGEVTALALWCDACGRKTMWQSLCRGGVKTITWGAEGVEAYDYVEGATRVMAGKPRKEDVGTARESERCDPARLPDGRAIHDLPRFQDGLKERRAKRRWKYERDKYGPKMTFTK